MRNILLFLSALTLLIVFGFLSLKDETKKLVQPQERLVKHDSDPISASPKLVSPPSRAARPSFGPVRWTEPIQNETEFLAKYHRALEQGDYRYAGSLLTAYGWSIHSGTQIFTLSQYRKTLEIYQDYAEKTPQLVTQSLDLAESWLDLLEAVGEVDQYDALLEKLKKESPVLKDSRHCLGFYHHRLHHPADFAQLRTILDRCLAQGSDPQVILDYTGMLHHAGHLAQAREEYRQYRQQFPKLPEIL